MHSARSKPTTAAGPLKHPSLAAMRTTTRTELSGPAAHNAASRAISGVPHSAA
jgi:hypothetical protein